MDAPKDGRKKFDVLRTAIAKLAVKKSSLNLLRNRLLRLFWLKKMDLLSTSIFALETRVLLPMRTKKPIVFSETQ